MKLASVLSFLLFISANSLNNKSSASLRLRHGRELETETRNHRRASHHRRRAFSAATSNLFSELVHRVKIKTVNLFNAWSSAVYNEQDPCSNTIINDGTGLMRVCSNRNIYQTDCNVNQAIIVIHGTDDTNVGASGYYDKTVTEAIAEGTDMCKLDVIAPQFFEETYDLPSGSSWENYYLWPFNWRYGDEATTHAGRSSYEIIDYIIQKLIETRPNLQSIVVVGHSAGGQFVNRYSLGMPLPSGISVRFWSVNPFHYMWLTTDRPFPDSSCDGYNNYPRGFDSRNRYMQGTSDNQLQINAMERDIYRTIGQNDVDDVSTNCRSLTQGSNRNERWRGYKADIETLCTSLGYSSSDCSIVVNDKHLEISGCGHGYFCSWESDIGRQILFRGLPTSC